MHATPDRLKLPRGWLDLSQPVVMGVLNVTPDSFSDGGRLASPDAAVESALAMVRDGAGIIDVGGESTRPGATPVPEDEEIARVLPVIAALREASDVVISIDTMKAGVMREAVAAGAELINDVQALRGEGAMQAAVASGAAVCLMHMDRDPRTMQDNPRYGDVVSEVRDFLAARVQAFVAAGGAPEAACIDPGFGFGKTLDHNLQLLARLDALLELDQPLLVGVSRKSMFGQLLERPVEQRLAGGLAVSALAVWQGARLIRSHDVRETIDAIRTTAALLGARGEPS